MRRDAPRFAEIRRSVARLGRTSTPYRTAKGRLDKSQAGGASEGADIPARERGESSPEASRDLWSEESESRPADF